LITLDDVREKISDYSGLYRKDGLDPIQESPIYILNDSYVGQLCGSETRWPDKYPHTDKYGVYAVFGASSLLYIGKASLQPIGKRLETYFRYEKNTRNCITNPQHAWSVPPTHVVAWAVPVETRFEASALEEYLIWSFRGKLSDNRTGNGP
jgi:hypothetical protein